jgi:hypothetical protein
MTELQWRKSSYSGDNGACIEIAEIPTNAVKVRDTKDTDGPQLDFTSPAWLGFIADVRTDHFNG